MRRMGYQKRNIPDIATLVHRNRYERIFNSDDKLITLETTKRAKTKKFTRIPIEEDVADPGLLERGFSRKRIVFMFLIVITLSVASSWSNDGFRRDPRKVDTALLNVHPTTAEPVQEPLSWWNLIWFVLSLPGPIVAIFLYRMKQFYGEAVDTYIMWKSDMEKEIEEIEKKEAEKEEKERDKMIRAERKRMVEEMEMERKKRKEEVKKGVIRDDKKKKKEDIGMEKKKEEVKENKEELLTEHWNRRKAIVRREERGWRQELEQEVQKLKELGHSPPEPSSPRQKLENGEEEETSDDREIPPKTDPLEQDEKVKEEKRLEKEKKEKKRKTERDRRIREAQAMQENAALEVGRKLTDSEVSKLEKRKKKKKDEKMVKETLQTMGFGGKKTSSGKIQNAASQKTSSDTTKKRKNSKKKRKSVIESVKSLSTRTLSEKSYQNLSEEK